MKLQTKIVTALFLCTVIFQAIAVVYTYACVSSGNFIEGASVSANLFAKVGLEQGLLINMVYATMLYAIPLGLYLLVVFVAKWLEVESMGKVYWVLCGLVSLLLISFIFVSWF